MKVITAFFSLLSICVLCLFASSALACGEQEPLELSSLSKPETINKRSTPPTNSNSSTDANVQKNQPKQQTVTNDQAELVKQTAQLDIEVLKKRLSKTSAIGFFSKLAIRNDLVDLMKSIKRYRKKSILEDKLDELRASFDGLLLKIVALLDEDPDLSRDLYVGREMIWQSLLEVKA